MNTLNTSILTLVTFIPAAGAGDRADRRLHLARLVPLLFLLGIDADPDGPAYRHLRARAQGLCSGQIFSVYDGRLGVHAGRADLALCTHDPEHIRFRGD